MHTSFSIGLMVASAALTAVAGVQQNSSSRVYADESHLILDWNRFAQQIIAADNGYQNPLPATRALAMMHLGMHDAINAAAPRYATYAVRARDQQADPAVAAAQAAHDVLATIYPGQKPALETYLKQYLGEAGVGSRVAKGVALGKRAAADIIAARADDRSSAEEPYKEGGTLGEYRFVPGFDFVNMPHWRNVKPFALGSPAQFRVSPPPALADSYIAGWDSKMHYNFWRPISAIRLRVH